MTLTRLFLFFLSSLGSFELLRLICKEKLDSYFLPSLTVAIQVTLLFFAGILNLLPETVWALYLLGFCGLLYRIYLDKGIVFLKKYLDTGYIVLLVVLGILTCYVRGKVFTHYDNFSHWALVVQQMLMHDRFPNFQDTLVLFQEYPLGSSVYIYFFAKLVGTSESLQMLAQIYMLAAAALPLFSFAKRNKAAASAAMLFFFYFVSSYNIAVTDLLVDTLLPMVGSCGLLFSITHCKKGCGKRMLWLASVYMVQTMQIKNSGVFFAALIGLSMLWPMGRSRELLHGILCTLFPFFTLWLWQKHCSYVFPSSAMSKHAMTVQNYHAMLGGKTAVDIRAICMSFLKFAVSWKDIWLAVILFAVLGCMIFAWGKPLKHLYAKIFLASAGLYLVYQLGMLAMYIFSMPTQEALRLASAERYSKTILTAILYLDMIPAIKLISEIPVKKYRVLLSTVCVCAGLYLFTCIPTQSLAKFTTEPRSWVEAAKYEYHVPEYSSYCVLLSPGDSDYAYFLLQYLYHSSAIRLIYVDNPDCLENITEHHIFIFDPDNPLIANWVNANFPSQIGHRVILQ